MIRFIIAAGAAVLFSAPAAAQENPKALQDAFAAAVAAEDANALAALYTEDADSYGPDGSAVKGRVAIAASWLPMFESNDSFSITIDQQGDLDLSKNAHASWGLWTMTMTPVSAGGEAAAPVTMRGRFTDVSVKTKGGWLYRVDHASPSTPGSDSAPTEE